MNYIIQEKDLMLDCICENGSYSCVISLPYPDFPVKDKEKVIGIMQHFQRLGFIDNLGPNALVVRFHLCLEAEEFRSKGGFKAQEELLQANIQRLLLEIEDLKPSIPDKWERITTIASNIMAALGFVFGK